MSGGGKGGKQTSEFTVPDWVEKPARRNLARAEEISQIGYVPYGGPELAAFTGAQNAAFANNNATAQAYGMQGGGGGNGMPAPQTFAGGMQGYSSLPLYDEAVAQFQDTRPGQYDAIMAQFLDPYTGQAPTGTAATTANQQQGVAPHIPDFGGPADHGYGGPTAGPAGHGGNPAGWGGGFGGYSGIGDMMDGGGPGARGGAFSGGGRMSDVANGITGRGPEGSSGGGGTK